MPEGTKQTANQRDSLTTNELYVRLACNLPRCLDPILFLCFWSLYLWVDYGLSFGTMQKHSVFH